MDADTDHRLGRDNRAMEGLPLRVLIAVLLGAAALAIMVPQLDNVDQDPPDAVHLEFEDEQLLLTRAKPMNETAVRAVDAAGHPQDERRVVVRNGTATLPNGPLILEPDTDDSSIVLEVAPTGSTACLTQQSIACVDFHDGQRRGTLTLQLVGTTGDDHDDALVQASAELVIIGGGLDT